MLRTGVVRRLLSYCTGGGMTTNAAAAATNTTTTAEFANSFTFSPHLRGFSSDSISESRKNERGTIPKVPPTVAATKNPTSKIVYDQQNHERHRPGDPSKRVFAYFVLTGGRFVYASLLRLLILKFILSMSASKDVLALALASLEVDLSSIEPGTTVTVKWRGVENQFSLSTEPEKM